ncbi:DUF2752 domain-containing protein [Pontibacter fetidus]|uniref:DUF2752 domain-containing protein n=1 Tax=Pontibacter fetidus TaxID=2700082 RepID=A0A6B2H1T0_9BACT|nr:DUF2752 domain-containing protein [Pontibacter fetidus]NDK56078.1 DUF2752 domain-containing protein [Pontibacter fetidus]
MHKTRNYSIAGFTKSLYLPEAFAWVAALIALALTQPDEAHLFSFCPFSYVLEWCPGCGLGHAIAWLARGELKASWQAHPLGVPAVSMLLYRSWQLINLHIKQKRQFYHN